MNDGKPRQREKPDFSALYEAYYDRIYRYAYTIVLNRESAEDIVAETFLSAYQHYASYDPARASPSVWLTRIAHNKAVNIVSSAASRTRASLPEDMDVPDPHRDFTQHTEDSDTVLRLYARLGPEEREFLDLRYVLELRDGEIAELLGIPVKTVNKRYQRLLLRCRDLLGGTLPD